MEESTEKLVKEMYELIEHMHFIGSATRAMIKTIWDNDEMIEKHGGIEAMCRRSAILQQKVPELHENLKDQYTAAVNETMKSVGEALPMLLQMVNKFYDIPDDQKKFASKMN